MLQIFPPNYGFHLTQFILMRIKQSTTILIYKKIHSVTMSALNKISTGKVINVVSNDLNTLMAGVMLPNLAVVPFVIIFTFYFLFDLFQWYSLFLVLAFLLTTVFQGISAKMKKAALRRKNKESDKRIKITT